MNVIVDIGKKLGLVPAPLVDTVSCVMRGRAILEANRFGIFELLSRGDLSGDAVAEKLHLSTHGTTALLDALVACEYLQKHGESYRNGPWVNHWILESGIGLTHFLKIQENVWDRASTLGECVRQGKAVFNPHAEELTAEGSKEAILYVRGMKQISQLVLPAFTKAVKLPKGSTRLADLGGSHGDFSRALLRKYQDLSATVLDLAGPAAAAKALAETQPDGLKLQFKACNIATELLGDGWDAMLLISVLHHLDATNGPIVFKKVAAALRPGGRFIVLDHFHGVSSSRDSVVAMMGLNYLTMGGRIYTIDETKKLFNDAGFKDVAVVKLPIHLGATIVQGTK